MRFRNKRAGKWQRKNQTNFCKDNRRRNLLQYNVSRDENPQRVNEMDSPSFEGFHAQLDCKLTYGNQNNFDYQLKLVQHIKFRVQKQNKKNRNDEKYSQTGITVKNSF